MPDESTPLPEWLAWLETLSPTEIDLGLSRVREVWVRLGISQPQHVFLIGGTNGKGSSVAMSDALLRAAGYRTGTYTSPHIHAFNERIRIDGIAASDDAIVRAFARIESVRQGVPLTYFEYGTLAALQLFADAELDAWVLEIGLGGRLDACNIVEPDASLITNIALDHCDWLGDDLDSIAREKAGIMRAGKPVIFAAETVPDAIRRHATELGAELVQTSPNDDLPRLQLRGEFQRRNAAGVIGLLGAAGLHDAVAPATVAAVLPRVTLPGRCEVRRDRSGVDWLFDVAHNPDAAAALGTILADDKRPTIAVIGVLDDKDDAGIVNALLPHVVCWIAVRAEHSRAVTAPELARRIANAGECPCLIAGSIPDAMQLARQALQENDRILVTGSFFAVGPVRSRLETELQ